MTKTLTLDEFINALTIEERYNIIDNLPVYGSIDDTIMNKWRSKTSLLTDNHFAFMLKTLNYDLDKFIKAISPITPQYKDQFLKKVENSEWFNTFVQSMNLLENNDVQYQEKMGVSFILRPFLLFMVKKLEKIIMKYNSENLFDLSILYDLEHYLAQELSTIAYKTIVLELNVSKLRNELKGNDSKERFQSFILLFKDKERLINFYYEYITLTRLLSTTTTNFIKNMEELLGILVKYKDKIFNHFDIKPGEKINKIIPGIGDTHEQGKTVVKIFFSSGNIIVYKPRNLKIAQAYNKFIDWLNSKNEILDMPTYSSLCFDNFTLEEFVSKKSCVSEKEIENYYIRFGQLIAIMYLLNGTDIHMENLIACGEYPYVVDLETLFQNDIKFNVPDTAFSKATYEMFNLVTKTSLLPSKTFKIDLRQNGIDVSALNGKEQEIPHKVLAPVNILTDEMRYELTNAKIPSAENIPELNGKPVSYNSYIEKIVQGFRNACNLFLKHKEELLNSNGILNEFKSVKIRIILRDTVQYSNIIQHLHHPDYMRDALLREQMLQNIWSFPYVNKEVINSEYQDLLNNDIPIFYSYTDSLDLIDSRGKIYKNYFEKSGFEKVMGNISKLCKEEINKQISVIYVSTGEYESRYEKYHKHTVNLKNSNRIDTKTNISNDFFINEAIKIGDYILQNAIFGPETKNKSVSWLTVNVDPINKWSIGPIGGDFYDGLAGLSLFYYYLFEVTGKRNYKELFEILIYSAKQRLEGINDLSCFTGRSSLLYPLRKIIENNNKYEYKTMLQEIINDCDKNMNILRGYDWIGGTTSLIDQFLKLFQESNDFQYLNLSIKYGNYLLKQLDEDNKIIGGFAHGASSIALVLIKLGKIINNKSFITKGKELLDYDRSLFHSREKGWIDKTEEKKQTFRYHWCHGSVGIGLSRIELSKFYNDNVLEDEIISSITSTLYNGYSSNDCLCHGNMGKTELFLSMYEKTGDLEYLNIAKNFGIEVIKTAKKNGRYQDRSIPGFPSIGIFTGIAGIGYQFLRIADAKKIPSILTLA